MPAGALVAKYVTRWVAGFRPAYARALISTTVAWAVVNVVGAAFFFTGTIDLLPRSLFMLLGWGILAVCHVYLLRSSEGDQLSMGKAIVVSLCQHIGAVAALFCVLMFALGVKQMLA